MHVARHQRSQLRPRALAGVEMHVVARSPLLPLPRAPLPPLPRPPVLLGAHTSAPHRQRAYPALPPSRSASNSSTKRERFSHNLGIWRWAMSLPSTCTGVPWVPIERSPSARATIE